MTTVMDEMKRISRLGCIDDRGEIAEILGRMSRLTLGELCSMVDDDVGRYTRFTAKACLYDDYGLDVEENAVENLGFLELLCLVDNTQIEHYPYCDASGQRNSITSQKEAGVSQPYRYVGLWNIFCLFETARKNNNLIRLFMALEVNELMGYLDIKDFFKHKKGVCKEAFRDVRMQFKKNLQVLGMRLDSGQKVCVEDLLVQAGKVRRTFWSPWYPVEVYRNQVLAAFELFRFLLIDCFKYAFPGEFCLEEILEKYGEYADDIDDMDDIDE